MISPANSCGHWWLLDRVSPAVKMLWKKWLKCGVASLGPPSHTKLLFFCGTYIPWFLCFISVLYGFFYWEFFLRVLGKQVKKKLSLKHALFWRKPLGFIHTTELLQKFLHMSHSCGVQTLTTIRWLEPIFLNHRKFCTVWIHPKSSLNNWNIRNYILAIHL